MAGYSGTPLADKLGIKPGARLVVVGAPWDYRATLGLGSAIRVATRLGSRAEYIHWFGTSRGALAKALPRFTARLADHGMIWISWPKRGARVATDLTENVVRELALGSGVVDVKVCAIDATWSGLKLVRRLKDRQRP